MIIFFGTSEYDSDTLIKECLIKYKNMAKSVKLSNQNTRVIKDVLCTQRDNAQLPNDNSIWQNGKAQLPNDNSLCQKYNNKPLKDNSFSQTDNKRILSGTSFFKSEETQLKQLNDEQIRDLVIVRDGKPYVQNVDIHFSLSHSHGKFVLAVSDLEVGIDLEYIRDIDKNKFYKLYDFEIEKEFFEKWTEYEAYVKYTGQGIKRFKTEIKQFEEIKNKIEKSGVKFYRIPIYTGFVCSLVSTPKEVILVKYDKS